MPGTLLHAGAIVTCLHSGQAQPLVSFPRVKVGGQPIVLQTGTYSISGCTLQPPPASATGPCLTAQWVRGAARIKANGVPVLLKDSTAVCTPTGTGLNIINTQLKVKGQ